MILELRDVSCGYDHRTVISLDSLTVESGEVLCLLGPNGSGKTTLFKTILGLLPLHRGNILIDGENIQRWPNSKKARVMGYIPQAHTPPFPYKVLDVVLMGRTAHMGAFASPSTQDETVALDALDLLGMTHLSNRIYTEISGGERQLVLIARALAQQPQILIMDEPTSSLDYGNQLMVLSHVQQLSKRGLAVVMASHHPDHAFLFASKVLLMKKGGVHSLGRPEAVITEANLKSIYGVEVRIVSTMLRSDKEVTICVPVVN